jgi:hypothetical protein
MGSTSIAHDDVKRRECADGEFFRRGAWCTDTWCTINAQSEQEHEKWTPKPARQREQYPAAREND